MVDDNDSDSSRLDSTFLSFLDYESESLFSNFSFRERKDIQEARNTAIQRQRNTENSHWLVYMKLIVHMIAAGTAVGSNSHFGFTDTVPSGYNFIADSMRTMFTVFFWTFIKPVLCDSSGECTTIAVIQFFRIMIALGTIVSEVYHNSIVVSITSGIFISLDPIFPMIVPILARITHRDMHILMFRFTLSLSVLSSAVIMMIYYSFGSLAGLIVQVCVLFCAFISATSLATEETAFKSRYEYTSDYKFRENLSQTYLWCCVFPVGATTTFIAFDACSVWGLGNAEPNWSYKEIDLSIAKLMFFCSLTVIMATICLHYMIPHHGKSRLQQLIWWSAYYMVFGMCIYVNIVVVKNVFGLNHISYFILGGIFTGLFIGTPDIVLIVESNFGADDLVYLCLWFEILHNLFSWFFVSLFRVLVLIGLTKKLSFSVSVFLCLSILVVPFVYVVINLFYDPEFIYETDDLSGNNGMSEQSPICETDKTCDRENQMLNSEKDKGKKSSTPA